MTKSIKFITGFLGLSMFMFGAFKFVNPFKEWYSTQIILSDLPFQTFSYWSGQLGEIAVGITLLTLLFFHKLLRPIRSNKIFYVANFLIIAMMIVAFYVHLNSAVPGEVLPMKIKQPFIPGIFLVMAALNIYLKTKITQIEN